MRVTRHSLLCMYVCPTYRCGTDISTCICTWREEVVFGSQSSAAAKFCVYGGAKKENYYCEGNSKSPKQFEFYCSVFNLNFFPESEIQM